MSDDETIGLVLGLLTFCCCCGGLLVATGVGLFFLMRRRKASGGQTTAAPSAPAASPDPAPPDAVRQALLALNRAPTPKPYAVRLDGDNVVCEWNTDQKLEIALDESTHTARFLESEASDSDRVKNDARQVIRSVGWTIHN